MNYSGLFRRLFAFTIDCMVLIGFYMAIGLFLGIGSFFTPLSLLPMLGLWFYGGLFALSWLYFAAFESSKWQATIGKQFLGIKVVDKMGNRIRFWRATVRYFSKIISRLFFMIGFLMILFTKKKQALHDKIASTLIVRI